MRNLNRSALALLLLAAATVVLPPALGDEASEAASVRPTILRCEYRTNPLGIDVVNPRLSWVLAPVDPKARGLRQIAYQVLVASSEEKVRDAKADLWDSGRVSSAQSIHVVYKGKPLDSGMRVWWAVKVWDPAGKASEWSDPASWSMGLLAPDDWKAKWIGRDEKGLYKSPTSPYQALRNAHWIWTPSPEAGQGAPAEGTRFFRAIVSVPAGRTIRRAICVIGADNQFEMFLNGDGVGRGNEVHMPDVWDVTPRLHAGDNVLAVSARNTEKSAPAGLIGVVRVEFTTGEPLVVATDSRWRASDSAADGWEEPGFYDSRWSTAKDLGAYGIAPWGEVGFTEERALPGRMLRKEFDVAAKLKRATVYVSGLGLFELHVNGAKVGDHVLSPGLTDYDKRVLYVTYDVTKMLEERRNAIGVLLGNGRYWAPRGIGGDNTRSFGYPKLLLQLDLEYEDGSKSRIVSDESWKLTTRGPIAANNEYDGEEYDARQEMPGWDQSGFDDSGWEPAQPAAAPSGQLVAQMAEPLRVVATLVPSDVTEPQPGVFVFDMGQNMVGWCRLKVTGPRDAQVFLRHAETLREDGTLYLDNLRTARAMDSYTLKGEGTEVWEPRFTYHGFRYVEVRGYPGKPPLSALEGRVVHDAMAQAGDFSTSDPLLTRIHRNIFWGIRGNYRSIPTDCPQRDERQGWLGDRSTVSRGESYLFDVAAFYTKWMADIADSQRPDGGIPDVAPAYWSTYNDDVTWPSTFILVPGMLYEQYGDLRVIERDYPAMRKWVEHMRGFLKNDLLPKDMYADWCVPPESPELIHSKDPARQTKGVLLATAYFYQMLRQMARYAALLEKNDDAAEYNALAGRLEAAFNRAFFQEASNQYDNGTQTSSILPLMFGITPGERSNAVFQGLIDKIARESGNHVGTGLVGAQWLMRTLSDNGRPDVAYAIATQKTYPGWGYMVERGATTIWELWNGDTADPAMNSGNHVMQIGDLNIWLYEYLGGIRPDPAQPGFRHIIVRPYPVKGLAFARATHESMYGRIVSDWKQENGQFTLNVTIPANTTATIYVPAASEGAVNESGRPAAKAEGVKLVKRENGDAIFETGSGTYSFVSQR